MKARTLVSIVMAGLVAMLLVAPRGAAAATKPASRRSPPVVSQEIVEQGSNGFQIRVSAVDRHRLTLSATKLGQSLSIESASYEMPFRSPRGSTEIKARFGNLGRVDMRFVPEKVKEASPPGLTCKGGKVVEEEGSWVGLLAFHGERGFTEVRVRSALGTVTKVPPLRCRRAKAPNLKKLKRELEAIEKEAAEEDEGGTEGTERTQAVALVAEARHHRVTFVASRLAETEGHQKSSFSNLVAVGTRHRGRIEETGSVVDIFAPGSYFRPVDSSDPTAEAVVKPPDPFSGSATYRTPPKGPPTWNGDLKVDLPGFGPVRLTGPGTRALMCESLFGACRSNSGSRASSLLLEHLARG